MKYRFFLLDKALFGVHSRSYGREKSRSIVRKDTFILHYFVFEQD